MKFFDKLKSSLKKSSSKIGSGITEIFTKRKLDDDALEELEELLIQSDIGVKTSAKIIANFSKSKFNKEVDDNEVKQSLSEEIDKIVEPCCEKLQVDDVAGAPKVIIFVGVNGTGKTTTIGKLAKKHISDGKSVHIAACDTFRAAAVDQLKTWADRSGAEFFSGKEKADPASVAYQAYENAKDKGADILFIDTAGRLQNKKELLEELQKIIRVLKKQDEDIPHEIILVLDSTTGQNAISQAQVFQEMVNITGLIITKLDGSAKGGVVVAIADNFKLPIYAIGVGEAVEDLKDFNSKDFANALVGL